MEICELSAKGSAATYLADDTQFAGYTTISWILLLIIIGCGALYLYAGFEIRRTHHNNLNFEAVVMWVGLLLNVILFLDYYVFCNDFFTMLSQAVQQLLILCFGYMFTL